MPTVVVYGPANSGKTTHAMAMASTFGCKHIVDDFKPEDGLTPEALHLTQVAPFSVPDGVYVVSIEDAIKALAVF
jgi:adenylate kinase family enzyme